MKKDRWIAYYNYTKNGKKIIGVINVNGFSEGEAKVNFAMKYPNKELFHIHKNNI